MTNEVRAKRRGRPPGSKTPLSYEHSVGRKVTGLLIREIRLHRQVSAVDFVAWTGMSKRQLTVIEKGNGVLELAELSMCCSVLNVPILMFIELWIDIYDRYHSGDLNDREVEINVELAAIHAVKKRLSASEE